VKAGFVILRQHGDHAFLVNSLTNRRTTVPLTRKALPVGTIAGVIQQAGLTQEQLKQLL